jgi:hypothetical protein
MNTLCRSVFRNLGQRITSLPGCFVAKVLFEKNAVRAGVPLAGVVLLGGLAAVYSSGGPAGPPPTGIGRIEEKPVSSKAAGEEIRPEGKPVSDEAAWEEIRPRLEQTERDSAAAVESQLARINDFFAECKKGARPFAEAVLSTDGKLQAAGSVVEGIAGEVAKLFGHTPDPGPDSFTLYVKRCFRQHVLDAGQLQKEINRAVAGYAGEVRGLEAKLLVDLGADLDFTASLPEIKTGSEAVSQSDAIVSEALHTAGDDFMASIFRLTASFLVGNAVGDQLTSTDSTYLQKLGINLGAGAAVDSAIDGAAKMAGYDPESALAAKITASLDRMRKSLVEGDATAGEYYFTPLNFQDGYPGEMIGAAARKAPAVIERRAIRGLRRRLLAHHAERSRLREEALRKLVFGPGATPAKGAP